MSSCTLCNLEININAGVGYDCIHVWKILTKTM
jgi:hypothetical protein